MDGTLTSHVSLRMTQTERDQLHAAATAHGVSVNGLVRAVLNSAIPTLAAPNPSPEATA